MVEPTSNSVRTCRRGIAATSGRRARTPLRAAIRSTTGKAIAARNRTISPSAMVWPTALTQLSPITNIAQANSIAAIPEALLRIDVPRHRAFDAGSPQMPPAFGARMQASRARRLLSRMQASRARRRLGDIAPGIAGEREERQPRQRNSSSVSPFAQSSENWCRLALAAFDKGHGVLAPAILRS